MIQITNKVIDLTLEQTFIAHTRGRLEQFHLDVDERVRREQPVLAEYIDSGDETLMQYKGDEGCMIRGGYKSASHLTFRMVDAQCKINVIEPPKITKEDIDRANDRAALLQEMHNEKAVENRLTKLLDENRDFGRYVLTYVTQQAPNEIVARGFALGILTTYSAYEQAFARTKK